MLESENIIVRRQSAIVLGKLGDEKALEILVEFLKDQRYESTIADIFYKQEGKSLKILLKALHESDDETKKKIIMRLSGFSFTQPWLAKEIVRFLESNNKDLRITASESLKTFANFEIVDEVLEILKEEKEWKIKYNLESFLENLLNNLCLKKMRQNEEKALELLEKMVENQSLSRIVFNFVSEFEISNPKVASILEKLILDEQFYNRAKAIDILSEKRDERTLEFFLELAKSEDISIRRKVASILWKYRCEKSYLALEELLQDGRSEIRLFALKSVSILREPRFRKSVERLLNDRSDKVRKEAREFLRYFG